MRSCAIGGVATLLRILFQEMLINKCTSGGVNIIACGPAIRIIIRAVIVAKINTTGLKSVVMVFGWR